MKKKHVSKSVLILASASPRRKWLLRQANIRFLVRPSHVGERHPAGLRSAAVVRFLAEKKASSIARRYPTDIVLGADTLVEIGGKKIGKPRNSKHAARILRRLSGAWQRVYTGVCLAWEGGRRRLSGVAVTRVKMRRLTEADIRRASRRHLDKAGAYAVQEKKDPFVVKMEGDYDNVVGLPVRLVRRLLRRSGRRI